MSNDFAFAAERIREAMTTVLNRAVLLNLIGLYLKEGIDLGEFKGPRFCELRAILIHGDEFDFGHWRVFDALLWFQANAKAAGLDYPDNLPAIGDCSRNSFPSNNRLHPHIEAIAGLIERFGKPSDDHPPQTPKTEGAVSQGVFVYNGKRTEEHIQPAPWRLLEFMEGKSEADINDAYHHAVGDHEKDPTERAINSMIRKANAALEAVEYPSRLSHPKNVCKIIWA